MTLAVAPRALVVADEWPWPGDSGYRQRLQHVVAALSELATVDYVGLLAEPAPHAELPGPELLSGEACQVAAPWAPGLGRRFVRWRRTGAPWSVSAREWDAGRGTVARLLDGGYDFVWMGHCDALLALGDLMRAPVVVDVDNVQSAVSASRLRAWRRSWGTVETLRCLVDVVDRRRWSRTERLLGELADRVVVCSALDQRKLSWLDAAVLPNGYDLPAGNDLLSRRRATAQATGLPPVVTMVATMGYEPNLDGALWFADRVLPLLATRVPGVRLRLVGSTAGRREILQLRSRPGIEVVGHVDDVTPYLAEAAVVVAPIRFGGGTRIKILEGFAHGVPVVSTSLGAEGLDVTPGEHLLVADTPRDFAAACERLLTEPLLAAALAASASALCADRYRWDLIRGAVAGIVDGLTAGAVTSPRAIAE